MKRPVLFVCLSLACAGLTGCCTAESVAKASSKPPKAKKSSGDGSEGEKQSEGGEANRFDRQPAQVAGAIEGTIDAAKATVMGPPAKATKVRELTTPLPM